MHILQCYKTSLPQTIGGAEQVIHHIAKGILSYDFQSTVVTFAPIKKIEKFKYHGYEIIIIPSNFEYASTPISLQALKIFKVLSKKADIIHYHYPYPWMDILHLYSKHSKRTVVTYHSDIVKQKYLLKLYQPIKKLFLNQVDVIVATSSQYIESSYDLQKYKAKTCYIPLGLDESHYFPVSKLALNKWRSLLPKRFLLFIGMFRYYKGLDYLFEALSGLNIPLVLVGGSMEKFHLQNLEKRYQLKNIHYLGKLEEQDKNAVLQLSAGLILPSHLRSEAFGLSLVEGAMFGKPLISCEIGTGTSFINQNLQTGWVVKPANVLELRKALQEWYSNIEVANNYGENARARYEEFFLSSKMVSSYVELYKSLK